MAEAERMVIPAFLSEAAEAEWRDNHSELVEERFLQAAAAGAPGRGSAAERAAALAASPFTPTLALQVPQICNCSSMKGWSATRSGPGQQGCAAAVAVLPDRPTVLTLFTKDSPTIWGISRTCGRCVCVHPANDALQFTGKVRDAESGLDSA